VNRRDPDRVPTPVSGRGDRKGHLFPTGDLSPTGISQPQSGSKHSHPALPRQSSPPPCLEHSSRRQSFSPTCSPIPKSFITMHRDRAGSRYVPTSPLSPRLEGTAQPISPQPPKAQRQFSRPMNIPLPKFHPLQFHHQRDASMASTTSSQHSIFNYNNRTLSTESPRFMKERQRELIDSANLSSRIAASSYGLKPDAPRLDPLGSPKGPVTPLALEETGDYFLIGGSGELSAPSSPGSRSKGLATRPAEGSCGRKTPTKDSCRRT
jgi:hypothetical protein